MSTLADYKLHMYNVKPKANTKKKNKKIQCRFKENTIGKLKLNSKNVQVTHRKKKIGDRK